MNSLSILLVDDDQIERIKFKKVCKNLNFPCFIKEAENGKDAMLQLNNIENSFDLVVTDLQMPQMNGIEFLQKVRQSANYKNIPIIVMSNSNIIGHKEECYNYGVSGYFTKPNDFSEYSKKVQSLLMYWQRNELLNF